MRTRFFLALVVLAATPALAAKPPVVAKPKVLTQVPKVLAPHVGRALSGAQLLAAKFSDDLGAFEITNNCKDDAAVAVLIGVSKGKDHTFRLYNCADAALLDTATFTAADAANAKGIPPAVVRAWTQALAKCGPVLEALPPAPPPPPLVTASPEEVKDAEARARAELAAAALPPPPPPPPAEPAAPSAADIALKEEAARKAEEAKRAEDAAKAVAAQKAVAEAAKPEAVKTEAPKVVAPATPAQAQGLSAIRASLSARTFNRLYDYGGNFSSSLSTYSMNLGGAVSADLVWYPGAHFVNNPLAHIGAFVQGDVALGLSSVRDGDTFGTHGVRFRTGVIFRIPVNMFELDLHGGYASQTYGVDTAGAAGGVRPNLPSVAFAGPRGGLAMRFKFSEKTSGDLSGGFLYCTSLGELGSDRFFPNASALGVDAAVSFGWAFVPSLELRFTVDYARYMVTVGRGSTFRASTATDQYFGGNVGLAWVM